MGDETPVDREAIFQQLRQLTEARKSVVSNWVEHQSDSGETYFYNTETQASVWEKPPELQSASETLLSESPWKEYTTQDGKVYFHNQQTDETRWELPKSLLEMKACIAEFNAALGESNRPTTESSTNRRGVSEENSINGESVATSETSATPLRSPPSGSSPLPPASKTLVPPEQMSREDSPVPEEKTLDVFSIRDINAIDRKDAAEAFRKFLDEKNVPSNINWENCVKIIQSDKRFDVWKKFSDRKQAFNQYKIQKQKQEKEDQRKRQEKAREVFEKMLFSTDKISYSTPYRDADRIFATDKIWRGVAERERESLYEDVMAVVEKREKEQAEKDREESMEKLKEILNNMQDVIFSTTWVECQKLLAECDAFMSDPVVKKINKLDALRVFMDHIQKLEKEHDEEIRGERRQRKRVHRKHREAYQVLLDELCRQGIITSMAKWKTVFPIIRNDSRFLNMQEQYGSNSLDLFKLYVKDLQNRYSSDLEVILSILKDQQFVIVSNTEFSDFLRILHKDDKCLTIDRGNIKMAFDALRAVAIQEDKGREEELRKVQEKETRQKEALEEAFYQMLDDSKMAFGANDKWLSVHEKFSNKSAYLAIRDEEDRIRLFHSYVAKMQTSGSEKEKSSRKKSKKEKEKKEKDTSKISEKKKRQASPVEEEDSKRSRSHNKRPASPGDEDFSKRSPKKKKRHHRSPDGASSRDKKRQGESSSRKDEKNEKSETQSGKKRPDKVVEAKAEKLAKELSQDELENQRKMLMKQLGLDD